MRETRKGRRRLCLLLAVGLVATGCSGGAAADREGGFGPAQLAILVYDRSTRIEDYQMELAGQLTNQRI